MIIYIYIYIYNHHTVNLKLSQYVNYTTIKMKERKDRWIKFIAKISFWAFGMRKITRKPSKTTSLVKKETVEESHLSKHSLGGTWLAIERDEAKIPLPALSQPA